MVCLLSEPVDGIWFPFGIWGSCPNRGPMFPLGSFPPSLRPPRCGISRLWDGLSYCPRAGWETTLLGCANLSVWLSRVSTPAFGASCPPLGIHGQTFGPLGWDERWGWLRRDRRAGCRRPGQVWTHGAGAAGRPRAGLWQRLWLVPRSPRPVGMR